jgi:hypothetical protein
MLHPTSTNVTTTPTNYWSWWLASNCDDSSETTRELNVMMTMRLFHSYSLVPKSPLALFFEEPYDDVLHLVAT